MAIFDRINLKDVKKNTFLKNSPFFVQRFRPYFIYTYKGHCCLISTKVL